MTGEVEFIERLRRRLGRLPARDLVLGIGDDCAIFRPRGSGEDLLFTTDMLLEDVHFRRATHTPEQIGYLALARGLSDIAAMGGEPRFCLLSLAGPADALDGIFRGLLRHGTPLAGGDLARSDKILCDIVVCGAAPRGRSLRRDGARAGDRIYVSGRLGSAAAALAAGRAHRPVPRLALGVFLRGRASAAMDLSDGLSIDLHRLCLASGVAAELDAPPPTARGASLQQALHGGEDYELLFAARGAIPARAGGVRLTPIGTIVKGKAGQVFFNGELLQPLGWDHFRQT